MMKRGLLIVFEGIDRAGKSSQVAMLSYRLSQNGYPFKKISFPARHTKIGSIINSYLKGAAEENSQAAHLLFSANRWEMLQEMQHSLEAGISLVVDRYAHSGVAYSVGALNLDYGWCKSCDKGLLTPDLVFYLDADPEVLAKRGEYGNERYEKLEVQKRVYETYKLFAKEKFWCTLHADHNIEVLHEKIWELTQKALSNREITQSEIQCSLWKIDHSCDYSY